MRWLNLEPIRQSEVSQKNKYCTLTYIYGIQKDGTDEIICNRETDTGHRLMDTGWGEGEGEIYGESNMET